METVTGKITNIDESGLYIYVPYDNISRAILRKYDIVEVGLRDGRRITPKQRAKIHALIDEIAAWQGELPEYVKRIMKIEFSADRLKALEIKLFSLSDCDVTLASEFITFLIDFVIYYEVPTRIPLSELCEDIKKYVYVCAKNKKCAVCGKRAELHHYDAVRMGNDRDELFQLGYRVIPLCREHHAAAHNKGRSYFDEVHLEPIPLTAEIGRIYGFSKKALGG